MSEYVLLFIVTVVMLQGSYISIKTLFQQGIPRVIVRIEKHLITGHVFSSKAGNKRAGGNTNGDVTWNR